MSHLRHITADIQLVLVEPCLSINGDHYIVAEVSFPSFCLPFSFPTYRDPLSRGGTDKPEDGSSFSL